MNTNEIYTTLPGVVVEYDGIVVTARPAMPKLLANGEILAAPAIVDVPVHWFIADGARAMITVPLKPGDPVTLFFASRAIETWLSGSDGPPNDPRQFDLTDCFCTPVMRPGPRADTENVRIRYGVGSMRIAPNGYVTIDAPPGMTINAPLIINGTVDITGGRLTHNGKNVGSTHVHGGIDTGPSNTQGPQ
jgi:hypothetical protein